MINLKQGSWQKCDSLINLKTKKIVIFETYYVDGMFKYRNNNQNNIIGRIEKFKKGNQKDS